MNTYEQKRAARAERLANKAVKLREEAESQIDRAKRLASVIPMGQPILVGHHSEGRDRRYRAKIDRTFTKGFETLKPSQEASRRATAAAENTAISSDDPDAIVKLEAELAALEAEQARMVSANKAIRAAKGDADQATSALVAMGFSEPLARDLLKPDFAGRVGFADYETRNNGANIRRIQGRITELRAKATMTIPAPIVVGDVEASWNVEANRVQIRFPSKPSETMRAALRGAAFLWAPSAGCHQRKATNAAWYAAKTIMAKVAGE